MVHQQLLIRFRYIVTVCERTGPLSDRRTFLDHLRVDRYCTPQTTGIALGKALVYKFEVLVAGTDHVLCFRYNVFEAL